MKQTKRSISEVNLKLSISTGNSKLGKKLPNISFTPVISCPKGIPCSKDCYACQAYYQYPNTMSAWDKNFQAYKDNPADYFKQLETFLLKKKPEFFRWHVAGDIQNQDYFDNMVRLAILVPETNFLAYTKLHDLDFTAAPDNLSMFLSMWPNWGTDNPSMLKAWYQDGTETRIPDNHFVCPGKCEFCKFCWNPTCDIVFMKHGNAAKVNRSKKNV